MTRFYFKKLLTFTRYWENKKLLVYPKEYIKYKNTKRIFTVGKVIIDQFRIQHEIMILEESIQQIPKSCLEK